MLSWYGINILNHSMIVLAHTQIYSSCVRSCSFNIDGMYMMGKGHLSELLGLSTRVKKRKLLNEKSDYCPEFSIFRGCCADRHRRCIFSFKFCQSQLKNSLLCWKNTKFFARAISFLFRKLLWIWAYFVRPLKSFLIRLCYIRYYYHYQAKILDMSLGIGLELELEASEAPGTQANIK